MRYAQNNCYKNAVLSQGNRAMPQLFFSGFKFADDIHYKFKSSQVSKARLQSSKATCFRVSGKVIDKGLSNTA